MGTEKHGAPPFNFFEHPLGSCFQEGQSRRPTKKRAFRLLFLFWCFCRFLWVFVGFCVGFGARLLGGEGVVVVRVEGLARLVPDAEVRAAALGPAVRGPRLLRHLDLLAADELLLEAHGRQVVVGRRARGIGVLLLDLDRRALLDLVVLLLDNDRLLCRDLGRRGRRDGLLGSLRLVRRGHALAVALRGRALLGRGRLPGRVHVGRVELDNLVGGGARVALLLEAARDGKDWRLGVLLGIDALLDGVADDLDERVPGGHVRRGLLLGLLLAICHGLLRRLLGGRALEVAGHGGGELLLLLEVEAGELLQNGLHGALDGGHLWLGVFCLTKFFLRMREEGATAFNFFSELASCFCARTRI